MEAVDTIVSTLLTCVVVDCVAADDTIVSTPLLYMNCNSHQFSLGFFVGSCYLIFCFLCSYLYIIVYPFVPFNLTIVLYVLFPITVSIYPFGICKTVFSPYHCTQYFCVSMRFLDAFYVFSGHLKL